VLRDPKRSDDDEQWRDAGRIEGDPDAPPRDEPLTALVIDDEPKIRAIVREALAADTVAVREAATGAAGLADARAHRPDLIVLDLGLPDADGADVARELRQWSTVPIIVLSARDTEDEKASLLDAGADDYVTKPFSTVEFRARARAQLRRARMAPVPGGDEPIVVGALAIDLAKRTVLRDGESIRLTATEWGLLDTLVRHAGKPLTHRQLFRAVWGNSHGDAQHYLRVYVSHLRRKLEADPYQPRLIITEPGVGYRFVLPVDHEIR
jgi:two-component system KDP operon response regulator KdpE